MITRINGGKKESAEGENENESERESESEKGGLGIRGRDERSRQGNVKCPRLLLFSSLKCFTDHISARYSLPFCSVVAFPLKRNSSSGAAWEDLWCFRNAFSLWHYVVLFCVMRD